MRHTLISNTCREGVLERRRASLHDGAELLGNGATNLRKMSPTTIPPPAVRFLRSCHPPHTDGLDHDLRNSPIRCNMRTSFGWGNRSRKCSLVITDGPGAAPFLAERRFLANLPGSRVKSSAGQCSIISRGISMMGIGGRRSGSSNTFKNVSDHGANASPSIACRPDETSPIITRRDRHLADDALSAERW